jgi:hypothetical protein
VVEIEWYRAKLPLVLIKQGIFHDRVAGENEATAGFLAYLPVVNSYSLKVLPMLEG